MEDTEQERQAKRKDGPVEKPKKLPATLPEKFYTDQKIILATKKRAKVPAFVDQCDNYFDVVDRRSRRKMTGRGISSTKST